MGEEGLEMSRGVYLLGVGIVLLAGAFLLTDRLLWRPGVTEANVRRNRVGMTSAQVEAILGGPDKRMGPFQGWVSDKGLFVVRFDSRGRVDEVDPSFESPPGPFDRLLSGLGLR
jgi:hypothetical protein